MRSPPSNHTWVLPFPFLHPVVRMHRSRCGYLDAHVHESEMHACQFYPHPLHHGSSCASSVLDPYASCSTHALHHDSAPCPIGLHDPFGADGDTLPRVGRFLPSCCCERDASQDDSPVDPCPCVPCGLPSSDASCRPMHASLPRHLHSSCGRL